MKAIIIASGAILKKELFDEAYNTGDFIICADGGLNYLKIIDVKPDLIVGDLDSVEEGLINSYKDVKIIRFNPEKDLTDTEIAINEAISHGFDNILIIGATGTRLDHTMANILLVERYAKQNVTIKIMDNNNYIQVFDRDTRINKKAGYFVSLVPITDTIEGITLKGMKYPLNNVVVNRGSTLCISNEIIEDTALLQIKNGIGILFISKD